MAFSGSSCALFDWLPHARETVTNRPILPPMPAALQVVQLEVIYVTRPAGDFLMGESLWKSLNQAAGSLDERVQLKESGLQFGIAPSTPPPGLQRLIEPTRVPGGIGFTEVRHVPFMAGEAIPINVADLTGSRKIQSSDKSRSEPIEVENAHCRFRMGAECVQDGWFRITFLPEIHHGEDRIRAVAGERGWNSQSSQNIESYFNRQFSVELNTNEYVVIGMAGEDEDSLGGLFFRGGDPTKRVNRLMIIRVVGIVEVPPVRTSMSLNGSRS